MVDASLAFEAYPTRETQRPFDLNQIGDSGLDEAEILTRYASAIDLVKALKQAHKHPVQGNEPPTQIDPVQRETKGRQNNGRS